MDKISAKNLIKETLCNKFDKTQYRNFIINFLDGIDEGKVFTCGNAYVPEAFRDYITSYGRLGKYTDKNNEKIEVLWVSLKKDTSLDRARTVQRNFVAWYLNGGRGGELRKNALVAFYNEDRNDWRFSFVKLDTALIQDDKGKIKIVNNFTSAKRFSFLVGEFEPNHTAQSRLVSLLEKDYPTLDEIEEAFNVEKVSKEFFENYKELFLQLTEDLKNIRENEPSQRINAEFTLKSISDANFCKKLLGQLVFLYFIQKKGWLGVARDKKWGEGDKQFLRHTFERAINEGKNFFNDYLEPLFYNALANGERDDNWFGELDCKIPFLNGGLFERYHDYDWVNTDIVFDNTIFSNNKKTKNGDIGTGILDVFERYNFTVKEDEPLEKEVAVDPEMLGKVFENLLEVQDRKSKGAFYTPREIVHYMCQESLINYLCTELGVNEDNNISDSTNLIKQDIEDFIHHSDKISQLENIATDKENENSKYKHIFSDAIKNNAKAIDKALEDIKICDPAIGSGAFPVGMLNEIVRARIALVESKFLDKGKKKTTYEYKRQAIQNSIYGVDIESGAVEIAKLRLWLSLVVDEEDIENIKALPNLDYKIVCGNSLLGVERNLFNDTLFRQLEELKPQFFNETRKSEKRRLKKQIDAIIKELTKDRTFDFEIYFSEVFHEKGGFDVVIGNPPYVTFGIRGTGKMSIEEKKYYVNKYQNSAEYKISYYAMFMELAIKLGNKNGISSYIVPDSFLLGKYFSKIRNYILRNTKIISLVLIKAKVFESANVGQSTVFVIQNSKYLENHMNIILCSKLKDIENVRIVNNYSQEYFNSTYINRFKLLFTQDDYSIISKIENSDNLNLNKYIKFRSGLISKIGQSAIKSLHANDETWKPGIFSGESVKHYFVDYKNEYLCMKKDIIKSGGCETVHYFEEKLFVRQTGDSIICAIDSKNLLATNNVHIGNKISSCVSLKYIVSILNSKLIDIYYKKISLEEGRAMAQIDIDMLGEIPIKKADEQTQNKFVSVVDKILTITQTEDYLQNQEKQNAVKEYEKQIDVMVYKLYELTYDEVLTIDEDFCFSEQEYNNCQL